MKSRVPFTIEVLRGNAVECVHQVMVVVCDERAVPVGFWGNIDYITFPRSSIKMLQALPFVESGAIEKFGLDDRMLALACASHMGEKLHLEVLAQWMDKIKYNEADLRCGPAYPFHEPTQFDMIKKGVKPNSLIHNCSGKHLGIISTCLALGEDPKDYYKVPHPAQARLRKVLTELMKVPMERMPVGGDGCGIPTYGVPLQAIAAGVSSFFNKKEISTPRQQALQRIFQAWKNHPKLVSGTESFSAALAEKTQGRCLLKNGAQGTFVGIMPEKGLSFALKVADGSELAAEVASGLVFKQFGAITESEFQDLKQYTMPAVKNSRGEPVGLVRIGAALAK